MVMHIDDIKALAKSAHDDAEVRERLFLTMLSGEGYPEGEPWYAHEHLGNKNNEANSTAELRSIEARKEASNAAWALTHLPKEDNIYINMFRARLVQLAVTTPEVPLRRLTMVLLERLEWGRDDVRTDLLDFCLEHMMLSDEPYGVKALCIKLAYYQCRHYPELCAELKQCLLLMEPSDLGAGVRHTRDKVLKILNCNQNEKNRKETCL